MYMCIHTKGMHTICIYRGNGITRQRKLSNQFVIDVMQISVVVCNGKLPGLIHMLSMTQSIHSYDVLYQIDCFMEIMFCVCFVCLA